MKNEFANRQNMHLIIIGLLDKGEFKPVWKDKAPTAFTAFTARAAELRTQVAELLAKMDRLVLRFRRDEPCTSFAAAWQAARIIRDLGGSAPAAPAAPATPPAP